MTLPGLLFVYCSMSESWDDFVHASAGDKLQLSGPPPSDGFLVAAINQQT